MHQPALVPPNPPWLPETLAALGEHEYLSAAQLTALVGRFRDEIDPLLATLADRGHVGKVVGDVASPAAYVLTRRGARYLAELTGDEQVSARPLRSTHMLGHELAKNDLEIVLRLLEGQQAIKVVRWETARTAIGDSVLVDLGNRRTEWVALVADAFAVVEVNGERTALLIEIDMATVPLTRMERKFAGYASWWRQKGPERKFGVKSLRVLTITKHAARMARLRAVAAEAAGSTAAGLLWFATLDAVDPEAPEKLLAPAFYTARRDAEPTTLFDRAERG